MRPPGARLIGYLDLLVILLPVYVLGTLAVDTFFRLSPEVSKLLRDIDLFMCLFFLADFCIHFYFAPGKWRFLRWGWVDLIASIPAVEPLRVRPFTAAAAHFAGAWPRQLLPAATRRR